MIYWCFTCVLCFSKGKKQVVLAWICYAIKATQNADWEVNHTDDKRDEKEEEQVQSLMLGTCRFQFLLSEFFSS